MKVAYLYAKGRATIKTPLGTVYNFDPWCIIDPSDWPFLSTRGHFTGCDCGRNSKPREWAPAFGTEQEIRDGLKGFTR